MNPEAAEAADGDRAVPADGPAADPVDEAANDPVADAADDLVARECPWVDSELLYFVTNDEGYPFNTIIPADEEAGIKQQQCFLAYEVSSQPHWSVLAPSCWPCYQAWLHYIPWLSSRS